MKIDKNNMVSDSGANETVLRQVQLASGDIAVVKSTVYYNTVPASENIHCVASCDNLAGFKEASNQNIDHVGTLDEQLLALIKSQNTPIVKLETDINGNIIVDKDKYPEIYDWIENG